MELTRYDPPFADLLLALEVAGLDEVLALPAYGEIDRSSIEVALLEFGRLASQVIAPTDRIGDLEGARLDAGAGTVSTPSAFRSAYRQYAEGGWSGVHFPPAYGGGGLPSLVGFALQEMLATANLSLSLNPVLTQSAIELLLEWGSVRQRSLYLPKLITGQWTGTMNLTEPDAGSDLGAVQTRAVQDAQGDWHISGTKVFITWGEHDLTENIVHLVLARTPESPPGTKGLSLFLVPKLIVHEDGTIGQPNSLRCLRLEEKLGIHASPTCTMQFDKAIGELVGKERSGINAMFTMMNAARLSIGLQGPSIAERAYQHARRYALERKQGRANGTSPPQRSTLSEHPDVHRMLLSMHTLALSSRLLLYTATGYRDLARHVEDPEERNKANSYLDLLTPVAKAWSSDVGFSAASTGVQILGGAGYIEETGMAQRLRDSRIAPIYEGTNGIQAIDLVMRKLPRENGRWIRAVLDDISGALNCRPWRSVDLTESYSVLSRAFATLEHCTDELLYKVNRAPDDALAGATSYLELLGLTLAGWLMIKRANAADAGVSKRAAMECEFFASEHVARTSGLERPTLSGAGRLLELT